MGSPAEDLTMQFLVLTLLSLTTATLAPVHYPNGAAVPYNGALIAATNNHIASKGYLGYPYLGLPYFAHAPLVAHPNGAVVPLESAEIVKARAEHLAAVAEAGRKRREAEPSADPYLLYGLPWVPFYHTPLVAHPNGAVAPLESAEIVKARTEHLAAVAEAAAAATSA